MNFRDYDPEELRALSRRAGLASGEARREKRDAIEHERITNAAMKAQEARNRKQHRDNMKTIREMSALLVEINKSARRGARYGW